MAHCRAPVLPTLGKTFRPDQIKYLAAGEKVRPLIKHNHRGQFNRIFKDSQCKIEEKI
jgi:hypothetical protein